MTNFITIHTTYSLTAMAQDEETGMIINTKRIAK